MSLQIEDSGETVQPGAPIQKAPEPEEQPTARVQISQCLENSLKSLADSGKESRMISRERLKHLSKESIHQFSERIADIAVAQGILPAEFEGIIKDEALDVEAFFENEALFEIYEKTVNEALANHERLKKGAEPSIGRLTVLKVVSISISRDLIRNKGGVVTIDGIEFYARVKKKQKKVYVIPLGSMKKIGSGCTSVAYSVTEFVRREPVVFKRIREKYLGDENTISGLQNSYEILKGIHEGGKKVGIQSVPHATFGIVSGANAGPNDQILTGFVDVYYEKDLDEFLTSLKEGIFSAKGEDTLNDRLHIAAQLLEGLATLHDMGITHGDIKEENILLKRTPEGEIIADIADFDDAKTKEEVDRMPSNDENPFGSYTPCCVLKSDLRDELRAIRADDAQRTLEIRKKRDVFAMGVCLYALMTGLQPYDLDKDDYPLYDFPEIRKGLIQGLYLRPFTYNQKKLNYECILKMLMPKPDQRCSAEEALLLFLQFMHTF